MLYKHPQASPNRRRGIVAPMAAILMVGLFSFTALSIDGGMLMSNRRSVQGAADAAALAAAIELFTVYPTGYDVGGTANTSAQKTAADNGYTNNVNGTTVVVNIPPTSGTFANVAGYAEVIITMQQSRYFSTMFGTGTLPVYARAVAHGSQTPKPNGIIVLDPSGSNDLTTTATGNVNVTGGNIVVDSSDTKGGTITSSGNITAQNIYFTGSPGYNTSSTGRFVASGSIYSNQAPTVDPLINLAPPTSQAPFFSNVNISGFPASVGNADPNNANGWILPAGTYNNGIHISDNNSAHTYTLASGIFYFSGGGLSLSSNAGINCQSGGVCLYFASGGALSITAGGPVTLSPLTTGPYANVTIYQDRSNSSQDSITGQTGGSLNITGTVYTPKAKFTLTGSGGNYAIGSQYIVYQLVVTGSGSFNVNYGATNPPTRLLYLCE